MPENSVLDIFLTDIMGLVWLRKCIELNLYNDYNDEQLLMVISFQHGGVEVVNLVEKINPCFFCF